MSRPLEIRDYATAVHTFEWKAPWVLVDGTQDRLNLTHECIDRIPVDATALRIQHADHPPPRNKPGLRCCSLPRLPLLDSRPACEEGSWMDPPWLSQTPYLMVPESQTVGGIP